MIAADLSERLVALIRLAEPDLPVAEVITRSSAAEAVAYGLELGGREALLTGGGLQLWTLEISVKAGSAARVLEIGVGIAEQIKKLAGVISIASTGSDRVFDAEGQFFVRTETFEIQTS